MKPKRAFKILLIGHCQIPEKQILERGYTVTRLERLTSPPSPDGGQLAFIAHDDMTTTLKTISDLKRQYPEPYVIILTKKPSFEETVQLIKNGADDMWVLPTPDEKFLETIEWVRKKFFEDLDFKESDVERPIITVSPLVMELKKVAKQVAYSDATVFIRGESGTGKELFARFIHKHSRRAGGPFVAVNCAAIPENLLESELFGYERGAFTGATRSKPGKFELARGGTLFLDEITEIPVHLQTKLLRVLQEGEVDRLGGRFPVKVDVRVIASSNASVEKLVQEGKFRKDLFYRLNVIPLKIPPLRKRPEDIGPISEFLLEKFARAYDMPVKKLSKEALQKLKSYTWPGNVRELENVIQRAILLSQGDEIKASAIIFDDIEAPTTDGHFEEVMPIREMEKKMIFKALNMTNGNRTKAAKILGITVRTLRNKLKEYQAQGFLN
ncbi:MAG: sigma-54-dependent Fis family transcriptional regulator [Deltaproteobacteria bacterium]|nr:sigma-54-dependent Fis family transcriptional regulator [Deltaproteobacteria bacterium]MBW2068631.1 sigma-54-dependent Fis family transcriptional regulator [Deltaproteobacteria bacterium]